MVKNGHFFALYNLCTAPKVDTFSPVSDKTILPTGVLRYLLAYYGMV